MRSRGLAGPTTAYGADDENTGEIRNLVGFHIRLAHGATYRHFTETFADLDLTQKQVSVLWLIDDHPGIAQTDLAQRMRMDRATTMGIVNRLQARAYLLRVSNSISVSTSLSLNRALSQRSCAAVAFLATASASRPLSVRLSVCLRPSLGDLPRNR